MQTLDEKSSFESFEKNRPVKVVPMPPLPSPTWKFSSNSGFPAFVFGHHSGVLALCRVWKYLTKYLMQCLHLGGHCKTLLKYSNMFSQSLHLGGHSKLGNDLSIGVNSSTKAWPEKICFQISRIGVSVHSECKSSCRHVAVALFFSPVPNSHLKERSQFWPKRQLPAAIAPTAPRPRPAPVFWGGSQLKIFHTGSDIEPIEYPHYI